MPLVVCLLVAYEHRYEVQSRALSKELILIIFGCFCFWCSGFGVLWASKWLIGSILLGQNIIAASFNQFLFRTGATGSGFGVSEPITEWNGIKITALASLKLQIKTLIPWVKPWMLPVAGLAVISPLIAIRHNRNALFVALGLIAVAALPYLWFAVASNHSVIHFYFTYRLQMGTIFALGCYFLVCHQAAVDSAKKPLYKLPARN